MKQRVPERRTFEYISDGKRWEWMDTDILGGGLRDMKQVSSRIPSVVRFTSGNKDLSKLVDLNGKPITCWRGVVAFLKDYMGWLRAAPVWGEGTRMWLGVKWMEVFPIRVPPPAKVPNAVLLTGIVLQLMRWGYVNAKQEWNIPKEITEGIELLKRGNVKGLTGQAKGIYSEALKIETRDEKVKDDLLRMATNVAKVEKAQEKGKEKLREKEKKAEGKSKPPPPQRRVVDTSRRTSATKSGGKASKDLGESTSPRHRSVMGRSRTLVRTKAAPKSGKKPDKSVVKKGKKSGISWLD